MRLRVIEYEVRDRDGDGSGGLIPVLTTITDPAAAPVPGRRHRCQTDLVFSRHREEVPPSPVSPMS